MATRNNKKVDEDEDLPRRPDGLKKLPAKCLKRLKQKALSKIEPQHLKLLMADWYVRQAKSTPRRGPFHLQDNGFVVFLCWKIKRQAFTKLLESSSWKVMAGPIRNQCKHIICWAYVSSDITSVIRVIRHWEDRYIPLCAWYLSRHVDPDMLGKDEDAVVGHECYGNSLAEALEHVTREGIPEELAQHREFDCCQYPPSANERKHKIKSVLNFNTLDEALAHLHIQPIGAALIVFPELWPSGDDIYYGPLAENSVCLGYHDVVIVAVEMFKGEQVALCKMSNGTEVACEGYVRVSLEVLYMVVGGVGKDAEVVRPTSMPRHLLSDFYCPQMDEAPRGNPKRKQQQHHETKRLKKSRRQREALSSSALHSYLDDDEIASLHGQVRQLINTRDTDSHDQEASHEEDRPAVVISDNLPIHTEECLQLSFGSSPLSDNLGETSDVAPQMEHSDARSTDLYGQSMCSSNCHNASSSGSRSISMPVALQGSGINEECPRLRD